MGGESRLLLWQDVRARAIEEHLGSDRRAVGERVAGWIRWLFLVAFALSFAGQPASLRAVAAALAVLAWAAANAGLTLALARRWRPSSRACAATIAMDQVLGVALVFLLLGPSNLVGQAFFLVVIASAIRLGTVVAIVTALVSAATYAVAEGIGSPPEAAGRAFLFLSLALVVGLMAQELERERRVAVGRAAQADTLLEMSANMSSSLDIKEVFGVILQHAVRMTGAEAGGVLLVFEDSVEIAAGDQFADAEVRDVAGRGEAALADAQMLVPIASGEGVVAVLGLRHRSRPFQADHLFSINALAGSAAVPLANALRYRRSLHEASSDSVTGLLNQREMRRRLENELAWRRGTDRPVSFILVDLDHFKQVNDTMGHQHGDDVLRAAARLLRGAVRAQDVVARYGGDEMAVIVLDSMPEGVLALARRLVDGMRAARVPTGQGQTLTLSLGVATAPQDGLTAEDLIMAADQALYLAKREGRDRLHAFGDLVARLAAGQEALLADLRESGPRQVVAAGHAIDRLVGMPGRSSAVAAIAEAVARRAGVATDADILRPACFLHDLGRVTADERMHALEAERLLVAAGFKAEAARAVRHHHERWDGAGTPDGLAGARIPLEARLVGLAVRYEALVRGRGGKPVLAATAAALLEADGGYDPALVAALREAIEEQLLPALAPRVPASGPALALITSG